METKPYEAAPDLEAVFRQHYGRIAKLITRITRDPGGAEELAVEVFLRWSPGLGQEEQAIAGWLTRTAVNLALDEIRRRERRGRLARWSIRFAVQASPEEILTARDDRARVLQVLAALKPRDAELLTLRAEGMPYEELAAILSIKSTSIGKLLSRAQDAFRKEYGRRYGTIDGI